VLGLSAYLLSASSTPAPDVMSSFLRSQRSTRILCGANPSNVGHLFVKSSFIDSALPLEVRRMPEEEGGMFRQYIPARLDDNPSMLTDDPGYEAKLSGMGSAELVRAMREGDWNVVEGAYFVACDDGGG
jgi:hypothetical protein